MLYYTDIAYILGTALTPSEFAVILQFFFFRTIHWRYRAVLRCALSISFDRNKSIYFCLLNYCKKQVNLQFANLLLNIKKLLIIFSINF